VLKQRTQWWLTHLPDLSTCLKPTTTLSRTARTAATYYDARDRPVGSSVVRLGI